MMNSDAFRPQNVEEAARIANSSTEWDRLWAAEGTGSWRKSALEEVYDRIIELIPRNARVIDVGGGVGILAARLRDEGCCFPEVLDHSAEALAQARSNGFTTHQVNLEDPLPLDFLRSEDDGPLVMVSTETLEHLSDRARDTLMNVASKCTCAFFSVPNDRLGPDEEPQHTRKFTAIEFKRYLQRFFTDVRVEVLGPKADPRMQPAFLLAVCNLPKPNNFKMSMTMPVRDEGKDIENVLASFSGIADEIVIGIDPRTTDNTREIAEKYADIVFDLTELRGPPGEEVPEGGFHFSHARNQCIRRCSGDWVFMTEGHERLWQGKDTLLRLGELLPKEASVGFVLRTGQGQQWGYPWLFRNQPDTIYFQRATHNDLHFPEKAYVIRLPQVKTLHERDHERELARKGQRKIQNRKTLLEDWMANNSHLSLWYLGSEWREYDENRAIKYLKEFLAVHRENGPMRYQTRLILAKMLSGRGEYAEAREILLDCVRDDWSRTDHWVWLGDLAFDAEKYEEALQFYTYASTMIGHPPFTLWWIDLSFYSYIPAQRLAMCYSALGDAPRALHWATRVLELLPEGSPKEAVEEATNNIALIKQEIST
jgi:tetratricopeptide (TPR) repeat protein/2-polyprenyl-3-methyl-5-hydroxy-6-metoxy-1,4-benzoquinol methylase